MRIPITQIHERSSKRPEGYVADVLASGRIEDGHLVLTTGKYLRLCAKYRQLGDVVELAAKPIAKSIDRVAGTNLKNCGGCNRRREALNAARLL